MQNPKRALELKNEINSNFENVKNQISDLEEKYSSTLDSEIKNELGVKIKELNNQLNDMKGIHNNYFNKFENGNINTNVESSSNFYEKYKSQIDEAFTKANNKADEISKILDNKKDNFMDKNPIIDLINDFKEYLNSLSTMEICLIINITSSIFIFTCVVSILFAISGNYLINKFSLEQNFPKLKTIIELRVKFQNYYVIINSIFILLAVLSLIFVNTITLLNG
jgi:flagellar biosynthesis chaperone FliJ